MLLKLTIFLGAFIAFALEPLIGRTILPAFGGTAAVWVTCLAAFQILMVGGYFYAARVGKLRLHLALLALSAVWCGVLAVRRGDVIAVTSSAGQTPYFSVLLTVLALCGVAFVLLSANSTIVQRLAGDDYRLYAYSNAGSFLGLLFYPFVFEPYVSLTGQWIAIAVGIVGYGALLLFARHGTCERQGVAAAEANLPRQSAKNSTLWWVLPGVSCFLLNALTTHVTLDIMPMPLVWTLTLALFLLSYVLGFSGKAERFHAVWSVATVVFGLSLCALNYEPVFRAVKFPLILGCVCGFLFSACTYLHTWLYEKRPEGAKLPRYNLAIAVGGAVGGVLASVVFPLMSSSVLEYPLALLAVGIALTAGDIHWKRRAGLLLVPFLVGGVAIYAFSGFGTVNRTVLQERDFFGVLRVEERPARTAKGIGCIREFSHGTTVHGIQAHLPGKERMPTTYYTPQSCGYAISGHGKFRSGEPMRVCLVGLGLGVLYAYARPGDYYRGYEISPGALSAASNSNLFTFVSGCPARHEEILEDARRGLEQEAARNEEPYDVIVIDAFSGDSQPYHLSTREAFALYLSRLKPDGVLCVNISNYHLDLKPFMKSVGDAFDLPLLGFSCANDYGQLQFGSDVAFFCRDPGHLSNPPQGVRMIDFSSVRSMDELPTDDKGSFISLVNW